MSSSMIGDMSQHFLSLRQGTAIKSRLNALSNELSTGQVSDISTHLAGETKQLALLDREIGMLDSYEQGNTQLARNFAEKQMVLSTIDAEQTTLAARFISITLSSNEPELKAVESAGREGFNRIASLLNTRLGDRSLFAGAAVDGPAVAAGEDMLTDILAAIGGAVDAATIGATIDSWFDDPAGGFATIGYKGDSGLMVSQQIGANANITQNGRADDASFRDLMNASAYAAVSDALSGTLNKSTRTALVHAGGERTFSATDAVRKTAARIGENEQRIDEIRSRQSAQRTTYAIARNELVAADAFDTASLLQSVQQQLELHYTATARLSRLSLANYL